MMRTSLLVASVAFSVVNAQVGAYGQCGGTTYSGVTSCVTGYYCYSQNPYYFQCTPGVATTTASTKPSSTLITTTKPGSMSSSSTKISTSTIHSTTSSSSTSSVKSSTTTAPISSTSSTSTKSSTTTSAGNSVFTAYAKTNGHLFSINGKTQYWMGTNSYWIGFLTSNADIDLVMGHLASTGLKVLRVWGFNDVTTAPGATTVWYQSFVSGASPAINTGPYGLQRLDYVVASAEAHGISLIINFVNNWSDYGGMQAYCTYYGISSVTGWYTSAAAQAQYKTYIKAVVSRYITSKAIFAWELANEPRCSGCDTSVITNWVSTTSAYIKSLDPNHMVTIGDEGFGLASSTDSSYPYTFGPGTNFTANLALPTIDFGTFHLYPNSWGETTAWGSSWIDSHAAAAAAVGKPVILEEYGSTTKSDEGPWQAAVLKDLVAGDMYWQYGDTLSGGMTSDDGNTIFYGSADYTTYVANHAAAMAAKAV